MQHPEKKMAIVAREAIEHEGDEGIEIREEVGRGELQRSHTCGLFFNIV